MARYIGPKSKIARRFGEPIFGADKVLAKRNYPPGQHGNNRRRKVSEYGAQLAEKQKAKYTYGVLERQFRKFTAPPFLINEKQTSGCKFRQQHTAALYKGFLLCSTITNSGTAAACCTSSATASLSAELWTTTACCTLSATAAHLSADAAHAADACSKAEKTANQTETFSRTGSLDKIGLDCHLAGVSAAGLLHRQRLVPLF